MFLSSGRELLYLGFRSVGLSVFNTKLSSTQNCLQHEILDEVACGGWLRLMGGGGRGYGRELKRSKIKIELN